MRTSTRANNEVPGTKEKRCLQESYSLGNAGSEDGRHRGSSTLAAELSCVLTANHAELISPFGPGVRRRSDLRKGNPQRCN